MYRLTYQDGDTPQTFTFASGEVVIGRSPECQIVLRDFGISRNHAKVFVGEDGSARIVDLKSKNGTQVNGVPVVEAHLRDGDRITLGKFEITFGKALESKVVLDEAKPLSEEAGTIIRSVGELSRLLTAAPVPGAPLDEKKAPIVDVQEIEKSNRILKVLTKVAETLIAGRPAEEGVRQVVDSVFEQHGLRIIIDPQSRQYMEGASIDYVDSLMGGGFAINNPNAVSSCGCGSSFRTKDSAATEGGGCGCH